MPTDADASAAIQTSEPVVRYLSGRPREVIFELLEPVEVDGVIYERFPVRRLTARDLDAYFDLPDAERADRPLANVEITRRVADALDADDVIGLREKSLDFLPRSWLTAPEPTPGSAGPTPSISGDSPAKGSTGA